jgi:hypothetical protein
MGAGKESSHGKKAQGNRSYELERRYTRTSIHFGDYGQKPAVISEVDIHGA